MHAVHKESSTTTKMYCAIEIPPLDRDLHSFVWRASPNDPLKDYGMTHVTFGVSLSSFVANMCEHD